MVQSGISAFARRVTALNWATRGFSSLITSLRPARMLLRPKSSIRRTADAWWTTTTTCRSPFQVLEAEIASALGRVSRDFPYGRRHRDGVTFDGHCKGGPQVMSKLIFADSAPRCDDLAAACGSREAESSPASAASPHDRTAFLPAHRSSVCLPTASRAATAEPGTTSRYDAGSSRRGGAGSRRETQAVLPSGTVGGTCPTAVATARYC